MSIVRMKHLRLIALSKYQDDLLHDLSRLGCVEISQPTQDDWSESLSPCLSDANQLRSDLSELISAVDVLSKHTKLKRGLFAQKAKISETVFFSDQIIIEALSSARKINDYAKELASCFSEEGRLLNKKEALTPWLPLDVPLETTAGSSHYMTFGVAPSNHTIEEITIALQAEIPDCMIECASSDREQHYLFLLCHQLDREKVLDTLKAFSFSRTHFKDLTGTARENINAVDAKVAALRARRETLVAAIAAMADVLPSLDAATDALTTRSARALSQERLRETAQTVLMTGWFPEREMDELTKLFNSYGAAYEIRDPIEGEEPPILTYNSKMIAPFGIITNMYSPPAYRGIDPNPFMAPFFAVFFGIMLSDAAYGLILAVLGTVVLLKFKPSGFMKQAMSLALICGVSTFVWGLLFGGIFGDAIPTVYKMVTGQDFTWDMALWFNPLSDPMKMLMFSFILGGIHVFCGMAIQAYMLIRDGHIFDAIFDVGAWWVLLAGAVLGIIGVMSLGLILLIIGAVTLILTQGRHEKNIFKKFTSGLLSLYNVTAYLGDILSYSRLLALSLATAVIASVVNTMGSLSGPIGFVLIFLIGHAFNISINLIGTFVHTSRLQYVEFFNKFYQGGGVPFQPLDIETKYVDIIKEEI